MNEWKRNNRESDFSYVEMTDESIKKAARNLISFAAFDLYYFQNLIYLIRPIKQKPLLLYNSTTKY